MPVKAKPSFSLRDELFNARTIALLADNLQAAYKKFDSKLFKKQTLARFPKLELKERINLLVTELHSHLPGSFPKAVVILEAALPEPLNPDLKDDDFGKYIWVVAGEYVAKYGCCEEHLATSLNFLRESTKRFSAEGAIRPFLQQFQAETMEFIHACSKDDNYHVRRLASEGIRPFLPWATRVIMPHKTIIEVLDTLHADPTRYVTRSVANTLNDISKQDAALVVRTLKRWKKAKRQSATELDYVIRHSLRTLLKQGTPEALKLLGFTATPEVKVTKVKATQKVRVGENYEFSCTVQSKSKQKLLISLCMHFLKANGAHSTKVFAIKSLEMEAGKSIDITKRQPFKPITTRTLYPGEHKAELVINGAVVATHRFEFVV